MPDFTLNLEALTSIAASMQGMVDAMSAEGARSASMGGSLSEISAKLDDVISLLTEIRDNGGSTDNDTIDIA